MRELEALRERLADYLQEQLGEGAVVRGEYPARWREAPPQGVCVAVGLDGASVLDGAGRLRLRLRFDILCPASRAGGCHAVFEGLCRALLRGRGGVDFGCGEISCGDVAFDRARGALALTANAVLDGLMLPDEDADGEALREIIVRTKGDDAG